MNILLLAGTAEARVLAGALVAAGHRVTASLAGVTADPAPYPCPLRIGGFGGAAGLAGWLRESGAELMIDATHPFATSITASAEAAAALTGLRLIRLERPGWGPVAGATPVPDLPAAARALRPGARVFLGIGRQGLPAFLPRTDCWFLVRSIDPMRFPLAHGLGVTGRPPFPVEAETAMLRTHGIDTVVMKESGGDRARLVAALSLRLRLILIERPAAGPGTCTSVDEVMASVAGSAGAEQMY